MTKNKNKNGHKCWCGYEEENPYCGGNSNWCRHYKNQCSSLSILLFVCVVIVHNDGLHKDIFVRVYHVFWPYSPPVASPFSSSLPLILFQSLDYIFMPYIKLHIHTHKNTCITYIYTYTHTYTWATDKRIMCYLSESGSFSLMWGYAVPSVFLQMT